MEKVGAVSDGAQPPGFKGLRIISSILLVAAGVWMAFLLLVGMAMSGAWTGSSDGGGMLAAVIVITAGLLWLVNSASFRTFLSSGSAGWVSGTLIVLGALGGSVLLHYAAEEGVGGGGNGSFGNYRIGGLHLAVFFVGLITRHYFSASSMGVSSTVHFLWGDPHEPLEWMALSFPITFGVGLLYDRARRKLPLQYTLGVCLESLLLVWAWSFFYPLVAVLRVSHASGLFLTALLILASLWHARRITCGTSGRLIRILSAMVLLCGLYHSGVLVCYSAH